MRATRTLLSSSPGFALFVFIQKAIDEFAGYDGSVRPPREHGNAVAVLDREGLRLEGLPQKTGDDAAGAGFPLMRDLLDGEQDFVLDIESGSHV